MRRSGQSLGGVTPRFGVALGLAAVLVGTLIAAAPAQAAAGDACDRTDAPSACAAALAVSGSVASSTGGSVTVTLTMAAQPAQPAALTCVTVQFWLPGGSIFTQARQVAGQPLVFRGTLAVPAGRGPGSYDFGLLSPCSDIGSAWFIYGDAVPAGSATFQKLTITGTPDTTAPALRSLTASPSPADVTTGDRTVTLTARISDAGIGVSEARVESRFVAAAGTPPDSGGVLQPLFGTLTRTSGTAADGTWTAPVTVPAGTKGSFPLSLVLFDAYGNVAQLTPANLTTLGVTSAITTTTTAVPPAATKVSGRTEVSQAPFGAGIKLTGRVTWTVPAGGGRATYAVVDSASSACGKLGYTNATSFRFDDRQVAPCTVKFRLINGAGYSKQTSVTFF